MSTEPEETLDCPDDCPGCIICYEDQDPKATGWVGQDGRP